MNQIKQKQERIITYSSCTRAQVPYTPLACLSCFTDSSSSSDSLSDGDGGDGGEGGLGGSSCPGSGISSTPGGRGISSGSTSVLV